MKIITMAVIASLLGVSSSSWAGYGSSIGMGYISKTDNTRVYARSTGDEVDETVKKGFPFIAFESSAVISGVMAAESISDGRLHVRYWKNGKDAEEGENTAWIDPKDVERFSFDCCGDVRCSGIKAVIFKTRTYSDCFNVSLSEALTKNQKTVSESNAEIEKLKLQLEIEKLKLEREKLKQSETK
ncbi:hypothetical protein [Geobacter sp. 60473]|uniref:hypothetical protein n=1 Tax=Geobacter sp. 60473 TaxID=3080755 RepID=UPI002B31C9C6|nr:hypothetical protein GEO60473_21250 [Geobacter sp. 60473]